MKMKFENIRMKFHHVWMKLKDVSLIYKWLQFLYFSQLPSGQYTEAEEFFVKYKN